MGFSAAPRVKLRERVLYRRVKPRQFAEERVVVIGEAVGDLVDHGQPGLPQHVRSPEDKNGATQLLFVARELLLVACGAVALVEQIGDLQFAGERALASDLGRVGGQYRADQRAIEEVAERLGLDAHLLRALKGVSERAGAWARAGDRVRAVAADVVLILGDVG